MIFYPVINELNGQTHVIISYAACRILKWYCVCLIQNKKPKAKETWEMNCERSIFDPTRQDFLE